MAHKKGAGSSDNGRDSNPKYLGVKLFGGQSARAGNVIIRQRGTRFHPGDNTYLGKDFTVHAKIDGVVTFKKGRGGKSTVSVMPFGYQEVREVVDAPKKAAAAPVAKPVAKKAEPVAVAAPVVEKAPEPVVDVVVETIAAPTVETVVETVAAEPKPKSAKGPKQDDLKIVEGIGPKIEGLLHEAGITTWLELSQTAPERIKEILDAAGPRYQMHDPSTWPKQAQFAHEGKFEELKEWQEMLDGGKSAD